MASLYLGTGGGEVYRLRQEDGAIGARLSLGEAALGPPVAVGDSLVVLAGERSLTALDRSLGAVRWRRGIGDALSSSRPYLWRGALIAGTEKGELLAFRASDGLPLWSRRLEGVIRGIGTSDRTFYVGTLKGLVYAVVRPGWPIPGR